MEVILILSSSVESKLIVPAWSPVSWCCQVTVYSSVFPLPLWHSGPLCLLLLRTSMWEGIHLVRSQTQPKPCSLAKPWYLPGENPLFTGAVWIQLQLIMQSYLRIICCDRIWKKNIRFHTKRKHFLTQSDSNLMQGCKTSYTVPLLG